MLLGWRTRFLLDGDEQRLFGRTGPGCCQTVISPHTFTKTPFFTALNSDVGVTYGRAYLHHRTEPTEQTFNESEVPARNSPGPGRRRAPSWLPPSGAWRRNSAWLITYYLILVSFIIRNNSWVYAMGLHNPCSIPYEPLCDWWPYQGYPGWCWVNNGGLSA